MAQGQAKGIVVGVGQQGAPPAAKVETGVPKPGDFHVKYCFCPRGSPGAEKRCLDGSGRESGRSIAEAGWAASSFGREYRRLLLALVQPEC